MVVRRRRRKFLLLLCRTFRVMILFYVWCRVMLNVPILWRSTLTIGRWWWWACLGNRWRRTTRLILIIIRLLKIR